MENATKALIIAGGVLISIIIASMLMLMFNNLADFQKTQNEQKAESEIVAFNQPYEGYHRDGVRGNELISLINRVKDYNSRNTRLSPEGTDNVYEPIEITIDITDPKTNNIADFSRSDANQLFTSSSYTIGGIQSIQALDDIKNLTTKQIDCGNGYFYYTEQVLDEFVTAYDKIFISNVDFTNKNINQKIQILYNFNNIFGKPVFNTNFNNNWTDSQLENHVNGLWNNIKEGSSIRQDINKYYEYVQFKRANFNCTNVKYNEYTGRIEKMEFEYTGVIS